MKDPDLMPHVKNVLRYAVKAEREAAGTYNTDGGSFGWHRLGWENQLKREDIIQALWKDIGVRKRFYYRYHHRMWTPNLDNLKLRRPAKELEEEWAARGSPPDGSL